MGLTLAEAAGHPLVLVLPALACPVSAGMWVPVPDQTKLNQPLFDSQAEWILCYDDEVFAAGGRPCDRSPAVIRSARGGTTMQTPIRHQEGNHDPPRGTAGRAGPRSRRFSRAAAVVAADIAVAALAAALIVCSHQFFALDAVVAILVLVAAVAAAATRPVQAFRGRAELDLLRQPLRPDLRPHLLQLLNYALLAALILIAGALGTFTNLPFYAQNPRHPAVRPDLRRTGHRRRAAGGPGSRRAGARARPPGAAHPQPRRPVLQCLPGSLPGTRPRPAEGCGGRRPAAGG